MFAVNVKMYLPNFCVKLCKSVYIGYADNFRSTQYLITTEVKQAIYTYGLQELACKKTIFHNRPINKMKMFKRYER